VSGLKYQPSERDWMGNDYADPTAWSKIHFIITQPIQFQYCYAARGEGENAEFEVVAFGDVDGDGVFSEYRRMGRIIGGQVVIGPIAVVNESE
jgi:hypothetical protein